MSRVVNRAFSLLSRVPLRLFFRTVPVLRRSRRLYRLTILLMLLVMFRVCFHLHRTVYRQRAHHYWCLVVILPVVCCRVLSRVLFLLYRILLRNGARMVLHPLKCRHYRRLSCLQCFLHQVHRNLRFLLVRSCLVRQLLFRQRFLLSHLLGLLPQKLIFSRRVLRISRPQFHHVFPL